MGLDMYLSARRYIGNWKHDTKEKRQQFTDILNSIGFAPGIEDEGSPHLYVEICVGYWRKANQIHKWFVEHVQDGVDNCLPSYVSREKLKELRALCEQTKQQRSEKGLPPQQGFFFGTTDVGDYYWQCIDDTIAIINKIIDNPKLDGWEFQYCSSW